VDGIKKDFLDACRRDNCGDLDWWRIKNNGGGFAIRWSLRPKKKI